MFSIHHRLGQFEESLNEAQEEDKGVQRTKNRRPQCRVLGCDIGHHI
jgi:hypothetical protein